MVGGAAKRPAGSRWPAPKQQNLCGRGRHGGSRVSFRPVSKTDRPGLGQCSPAVKLGLPSVVASYFWANWDENTTLAFEGEGPELALT